MNFLITISLFISTVSIAQIQDDFSDGEFSTNPIWGGNAANFTVNTTKQLQSKTAITGTTYLSTLHNLTNLDSKEWHFWAKLAFSPSTSNYARIYLSASQSDLSLNPSGYYLQLGESGTKDAVRLMKNDNGTISEICSGLSGQIAKSFTIGIKVVRNKKGEWKLFVDPTGGENFNAFAIGNDSTQISGSTVGLFCKYTAGNSAKFYFDNITVGDEIRDLIPPILVSATIINTQHLDVLFDQPLDTISGQLITNYSINPAISISSVIIDTINPALVHLLLTSPLQNGEIYVLTTDSIADNLENISTIQTSNFTYLVSEISVLGDVIISEIMADPTPTMGLPEVEYIEIYNRSNKHFNLKGWKISDATGDGTIAESWLKPGEYRVICSTSSVSSIQNSIGATNFPSYNNAGDDVNLKTMDGIIIDNVSYIDSWYLDEGKKEGGYTLERINLTLPCSNQNNWNSSIASIGGTPGTINSINNSVADSTAPFVINYTFDSTKKITLNFNEGMDSLSLINASISINPSLTILQKSVSGHFPTQLSIEFSDTILGSKEYTISLKSVSDCSFNGADLSCIFVRPEAAEKGDIIINEILFDPLTGGSDFIELYNKSSKLIDLKNWNLGNIEKGEIANLTPFSANFNLKSGGYVVITPDSSFQKEHYSASNPGHFIQATLPNYNIDSSSVCLLFNGDLMDKVGYKQEWNFTLLDDSKGKSLERISADGNSSVSTNWHTAAESVNFATPGRINSQDYKYESTGDFEFSSKTVSPDNDGFEDVLHVKYKMKSGGMIGTFSIYDATGRLIKTLFKNDLLATEGSFSWDGITLEQVKAPIGTYIGILESFDADGGTNFTKRKAFVVAGKL